MWQIPPRIDTWSVGPLLHCNTQKYACVLLKTHRHKQTHWTHPQSHWLGFPAENKASKLLPPLNPPLSREETQQKIKSIMARQLVLPAVVLNAGLWESARFK